MKKRHVCLLLAFCLALSGCGIGSSTSKTSTSKASGDNDTTSENTEDDTMSDKIIVSMDEASPFNDGSFEGFGTSLCWFANRIGYSDTLSQEAADLFYDADEGLGLTIARYNIGGGDDPTHNHITRTDSIMPGFATNWTYDESTGEYTWDYDWTQDSNQINVLQKCIDAAGDNIIVEAFSNSAPYFMTKSGCSSGAVDASRDNLKEDAYDAFAKYICDVMVHFDEDLGIKFQSVSAMNEPYTSYWGAYSEKQEGCHFEPGDSQSNMIIAMEKAMADADLSDVILTGTDETSIDKQILSFNALSDEAKNAVERIDSHAYQGDKRTQLKELALANSKGLWMSEVDDGGVAGENAGEMGAGLWLANEIVLDLNEMQPSAWVLWQAIGSHISSEGYMGNQDSGMGSLLDGYWGVAFADHDNEEIILTMKYYCFGQFTRYIKQGSTILATGDNTIGAYNADTKELVLVAVNDEAAEKEITFDLSAFSQLSNEAEAVRTSGSMASGEKWASLDPVALDGTDLTVTLKGNSVTTYIIKNVEQ